MTDTRVGFVTPEEYRAFPGAIADAHAECETQRHEGQGIPAIVVVAMSSPVQGDIAWGACAECFAQIDLSLESGKADWHLGGEIPDV